MPASRFGDALIPIDALLPESSYIEVTELLQAEGWTPCGEGDWAFALRSPSGELAARISPFDPAARYSAMLYRVASETRQVPGLIQHRRLLGGAELTVLEYLSPVPTEEAASFLRAISDRSPEVRELADLLAEVHALGAVEQPWWGPVDDNPGNVMRAADGRLVLTDPFYADGPNLYAAVLDDPDSVTEAIPEALRRHMTELPLANSQTWTASDRRLMRARLAESDARRTSGASRTRDRFGSRGDGGSS